MIFDTHIHLNSEEYTNNLIDLLNNAKNKGVTNFLCIGYDVESSKKAIEIADQFDFVYASVGLIPTEWKQYNDQSISDLEKLILSSKKVICIGEIGLDYYWEKKEKIKTIQKDMFIKQIELANRYNLPLSLHIRDAYQDAYDTLKSHICNQKGILHCYSGSLEMAMEFIKLGYKIAFGGVLTFKNAKTSKDVFLNLDLKDIVFETDAPYLSPTPFRGKINLPEYIVETVKYASELRNISFEELCKITYMNSINIFHVKTYENKD